MNLMACYEVDCSASTNDQVQDPIVFIQIIFRSVIIIDKKHFDFI